jgi:hypothetical protein
MDFNLSLGVKKTLTVLNEMESQKVIRKYAIGGAVAAYLYLEPAFTADIDIFCLLDGSGLGADRPIWEWLEAKGYKDFQREGVMIGEWAVQFIPVFNPLTGDALKEAIPTDIDGVPTHVFSQEHLMAICLDTGRPKDFSRLAHFLSHDEAEGGPDKSRFMEIVNRFDLGSKWEKFNNRLSDL